jgi:hypothetical protein
MRKIQGLLLAVIFMLTANGLMAQSYAESALLFGRTRAGGSARIQAMGGAQISLGGDFSSAASNPAGLGMYNRSEFTISPGFLSSTTNGTYTAGSTLSDNNTGNSTALTIGGLGLAFAKPAQMDGPFVSGTFAITLNRMNDFNQTLQYSGVNAQNSLVDYFINQANGDTPDQFSPTGYNYNTVTEMAYDNYLIGPASFLDPSYPDDQYFTDFDPTINPNAQQSETVTTKGGSSQWNISYGANFNDKFFLGAGLGIVPLNFQQHKVFTESFTSQPINGYNLTEDLQVKGTGVNLTVGAIVRPMEGLQIGASIATPTRYNLNENYSASMASSWNNFNYGNDDSGNPIILNSESSHTDVVNSRYVLYTPWKFSGGVSYIFGKVGLISLDIEDLNYGSMSYDSKTNGVSFDGDNDDIKKAYVNVINIRAGGEVRVKAFRFRGGAGLMPDPYKSTQNGTSIARTSVSGGVGYRKDKFFIDVAYVRSWGNNSYRPYTLPVDSSPLLTYTQTSDNFITTVGFIF